MWSENLNPENRFYSKSIKPMLSETSKHTNEGELQSAPMLTNKTKHKFHYSDCSDLNMQTPHKAQFTIKYLFPEIESLKILHQVFFITNSNAIVS